MKKKRTWPTTVVIAVLAGVIVAFLYAVGTGTEEQEWVVGPVTLDESLVTKTVDTETNITALTTYMLKGEGSSMSPKLTEGELYLCIKQKDYKVGDVVAYKGSLEFVPYPTEQEQQQGYSLTGHRIINKGNGYFWVRGDNAVTTDVVKADTIFCRILIADAI